LVATFREAVPERVRDECRRMLIAQSRCMRELDEIILQRRATLPNVSLVDYERLIAELLHAYVAMLSHLPDDGTGALDLRVVKYRAYREYQAMLGRLDEPSADIGRFLGILQELWKETSLTRARGVPDAALSRVTGLRSEHPRFATSLAGPLLAIEARCALLQDPPSHASLQRALNLYQEALDHSRYAAGRYTKSIAREALGLAALLYRHASADGPLKPWIKNVLSWWDLLNMGSDFDHEQLEQRIERAESHFSNSLSPPLRERLTAALPTIGSLAWDVGGFFRVTTEAHTKSLEQSPLDPRQKRTVPSTKTLVSRDQSPLMEAIDRNQLGYASKLVREG